MSSTSIYLGRGIEQPKSVSTSHSGKNGGKTDAGPEEGSFRSILQDLGDGRTYGGMDKGETSIPDLFSALLLSGIAADGFPGVHAETGEKGEESPDQKQKGLKLEDLAFLLAGLFTSPNSQMGEAFSQSSALSFPDTSIEGLVNRLLQGSGEGNENPGSGESGSDRLTPGKWGSPLIPVNPGLNERLIALLQSLWASVKNEEEGILLGENMKQNESGNLPIREILSRLVVGSPEREVRSHADTLIPQEKPFAGDKSIPPETLKQLLAYLTKTGTHAGGETSSALTFSGRADEGGPSFFNMGDGIFDHDVASKKEGDLSKAGFLQLLGGLPGRDNAPQAGITLRTADPVQFQEKLTQWMLSRIRLTRFPDGSSEARLKLIPESLGSIDVKIAIQHGIMQATFIAETAQGKQLLENSIHHLRQQLLQQGIQVDKMEILTPQKEAQQGIAWQGEGEDRRGRPRPSPQWRRESEADEEFSILMDGRVSL